MTEREYIDLSDRVKISMAREILSEITPGNLNQKAINIDEFIEVIKKIWDWEDKLREVITVD